MDVFRASDTVVRDAALDARIRLDTSACVTAQRPGTPCNACEASCSSHAIRVSDRQIEVNHAACSGCGLCAPSCPTGAIEVTGFRPALVFECARVRRPADGARQVACLAGLTASTLRRALRDGDVTLIDRGWCKDCTLSKRRTEPWSDTVTAVNDEMEALGCAQRVSVRRQPTVAWRARPAPRPATDNPGRRGLFDRVVHGNGTNNPSDRVPGKARVPGPMRRAAELAALAGNRPVSRTLFPALERTGASTDLDTLARLCPTVALRIVETDGARALVFDARACTGCGICTASGALRTKHSPSGEFAGPETLATEPRAACTRCRMRFTPKGTEATCPACGRDTDLAAFAHGLRRRVSTQTEQP